MTKTETPEGKVKPKSLGDVAKTERGFELLKFRDKYGAACSLQQSSLAEYTQPVCSAVWLGLEEAAQPHHVTGVAPSPRMHLDRKQVRALVRHLRRWLKANTFELEDPTHG